MLFDGIPNPIGLKILLGIVNINFIWRNHRYSPIYRIDLNWQHFYEKTLCLTESSAAGEKNMGFYVNITGFPSQNSTELSVNRLSFLFFWSLSV